MRCEHETSVGAYVLDALEPDEQLAMQQHVQECPVCGDAVRELEALPRLLSSVPTPGETPVAPVPSEMAFQRFRRSAAALPGPAARRRRRRRWTALVAAALVLVAGVVGVSVVALRDPEPTVVAAADDGVWAEVSYVEANHGTAASVELDGFPVGARCELYAVSRDGREESAGDWSIRSAGTIHWKGWVSLEPSDVHQWEVRTGDGRTLLTVPT